MELTLVEPKMMTTCSRTYLGFRYTLLAWTVPLLELLLFLAPSQAAAEYRLDVGDVLEITVAGAPELQRRAAINLNGEVSFPLVGEISVAGITLSELRAKVRGLLSQIEYRSGRAAAPGLGSAIKSEEITVNITEYRPIYLTGDVAQPGEKQYRPGMSVRQAISVAGGFDIARSRMSNALLDSADLRGEYESLSTELVREKARAWRLQAELGRSSDLDTRDLPPIAPRVLSEIAKLEAEQLRARQTDFQKEKDHLRDTLEQTDRKIASLAQQYNNEEEGTRLDIEEMDRVTGLFQKGLVPATRVTETRRSTLLSSTRALQTNVQLEETRRYRHELDLRLQRMDDQRSINLFDELQNTNLRVATLQAKVQATAERLFYISAAKSQMVLAAAGKTTIVVFRKDANKRDRIDANEDTQLLPGDVIEVSINVEYVNQFSRN